MAAKKSGASKPPKRGSASPTNSTETGHISVHTDDLFPIIKKWLYSEHDIFLRELVANAYDAITKRERLADIGEAEDFSEPLIQVRIDKPKNLLVITDNGLGMDAGEVKRYINQIAFSGAREFVEKYEGKSEDKQIIGHFGLGFFSAFMVADKVEIHSLSYRENAEGVHWECDGSTSFALSQREKTDVGTEIVLHLSKEAQETFLEEAKVKELITKYSNFLPVEIRVNGAKANAMNPLWQRDSKAVKDEEYKSFHQSLFPYQDEPLFHVHLNVDYPFRLKGILYFPKIKNDFDLQHKGRLKLFCNHVFVSDNIIDIVPQYLNLLQGVLDSPDIPLNVSRSFLQKDPNVQKIGKHIVKKVAETLASLHKRDEKKYEEYWKDIQLFVKLGVIHDEDFAERVQECLLFESTDGKWMTLEQYASLEGALENKVLYTSDVERQVAYVNRHASKGIPIVVLNHPIDGHFMQHLEMKRQPLRFLRVDSDVEVDSIDDQEGKKKQKPKTQSQEALVKLFQEALKKERNREHVQITFKTEASDDTEWAGTIVQSEQMRRFSEMNSIMQGKGASEDSLMQHHTLVLNPKNPLVKELSLRASSGGKVDVRSLQNLCVEIYDLALLQQGSLKGDDLDDFVKRTTKSLSFGALNQKPSGS